MKTVENVEKINILLIVLMKNCLLFYENVLKWWENLFEQHFEIGLMAKVVQFTEIRNYYTHTHMHI